MSDSSSTHNFCNKLVCPLPTAKFKRMKSNENRKYDFYNDLKCGEQVYAVKSYSDYKNSHSLSFVEGDILTIIDQYPDGLCKGFISKHGQKSKIGYFPTTNVVPFKTIMGNQYPISCLSPKKGKHFNKTQYLIHNSQFQCQKSNSSTAPVTPAKFIDQLTVISSTNSNLTDHSISLQRQQQILPLHKRSHDFSNNSKSDNVDPVACTSSYHHPSQQLDNLDNPDNQANLDECCNRSSSISMDSGWGSANTAIMSNIKSIPEHKFLPTISNSSASHSMESGLASIQDQRSSSSNSSLCSTVHPKFDGNNCDSSDQINSDELVIKNWLESLQMERYKENFVDAGYDFSTLLRMTPEDLNAIGITNPIHRKLLKTDINHHLVAKFTSNGSSGINELNSTLPNCLESWLASLNLRAYLPIMLQQGYDTLERIYQLNWEDLEEIGIKKLGHQKKMMLSLDHLKKKLSQSQIISSSSNQDFQSKLNSANNFLSPSLQSKDISHRYTVRPSPPIRQPSTSLASRKLSTGDAPPTPKRTSSIPFNSYRSQIHKHRHAYVNLDCVGDHQPLSCKINPSSTSAECDSSSQISPKSAARSRSNSIMSIELNLIPFANEDCGTIKQRSSSLGRNELLREEIENGVVNLKSLFTISKPSLPLNLPYKTESSNYKAVTSLDKLKTQIGSYEKNVQVIPSDVHVAARERVPLPKMHLDDNNSSTEDFNDICDMLEDLTEMLDKQVHHIPSSDSASSSQ